MCPAPQEIDRIGRICQRDWFQRIWTAQEFLLSETAVFMVGRQECAMSQLYTYFIIGDALLASDSHQRRLFRLRSLMMEEVREIRDAQKDEGLLEEEENMSKKQHANSKNWLISQTTHFSDRSPGGGTMHIFSLILQMAAMSDATDARDKVYGMLAFISKFGQHIHVPDVDYSKTIAEVYEEFAICMIRSTSTLWHLEHIASHGDNPDWPTWVPDLRTSGLIASPKEWCSGLSRSPTRGELDTFQHKRHGRLKLQGRRMTRVSRVFARMPCHSDEEARGDNLDNARTDCLSQWTAIAVALDLNVAEAWNRQDNAQSEDSTTYENVIVRLTPYLRYLRSRHEVDATYFHSLRDERKQKEPSTLVDLLKATFVPQDDDDELGGVIYEREMWGGKRFDDLYDGSTLFLASGGLLGLCRGDVHRGDELFQLSGARYPFVLRKIGRRQKDRFQLVGVASVGLRDPADKAGLWYDDITKGDLEDVVLV
jgi:hypothetical protein